MHACTHMYVQRFCVWLGVGVFYACVFFYKWPGLSKKEPWAAVSTIMGLIYKVQSHPRAWWMLHTENLVNSSSLVGQVCQWLPYWLCRNFGNLAPLAREKPLPVCQGKASNHKPPAQWLQGRHVFKNKWFFHGAFAGGRIQWSSFQCTAISDRLSTVAVSM